MKIRILVLFILFSSCVEQQSPFNRVIQQSEYSVLMFLAPDCPLCLTFTKPFNELATAHPEVQFIGVLSGENYTDREVEEFRDKSGFDRMILYDKDLSIAHEMNAQVTPEFFLISAEGGILYKGLLDDRMERLGVYKQHWENFYLKDALDAVEDGREIEVTSTEAVGCVLEY